MDYGRIALGIGWTLAGLTVIAYVLSARASRRAQPGVAVAVLGSLTVAALGIAVYLGGTRTRQFKDVDLKQFAAMLSQRLKPPANMPDGSRLDRVEGVGNVLVFHYTLASMRVDDATFMQRIADMKARMCTAFEEEVMRGGHNVEYRFSDNRGAWMYTVTTTPADCRGGR